MPLMIMSVMASYALIFGAFSSNLGPFISLLALFGTASSDGESKPYLGAVFKQISTNDKSEYQKHQYKITVTSPTPEKGILILETNHGVDPKAWGSLMQTADKVSIGSNHPHSMIYNAFMADNEYYRMALMQDNQKYLYSNICIKNHDGFSSVDWVQAQNNEKKQLYIGIGIVIVVLIIMIVVSIYVCQMFSKAH